MKARRHKTWIHELRLQETDLTASAGTKEEHGSSGTEFETSGRYAEALACFDRATQMDELSAEAWWQRGSCLKSLGQWEDSLQSFDKALKVEPTKVGPCLSKGHLLAELGRFDEAISTFDLALQIAPDSDSALTCAYPGLIFAVGSFAEQVLQGSSSRSLSIL